MLDWTFLLSGMGYKLILTKSAEADLGDLDDVTVKRILKKLLWFGVQEDPRKWSRFLEGNPGGDLRFRIGDYRAVGVVKERQIFIVKIGHRSTVYR